MVFQVIFSPIEHLLAFILELSYAFSNNYGIAIILLSLFVNLLLLPIYILAEKLQEKEITIRNVMQKKIDEIKLCFRGQERFMMIQTLYRIHKYHPIMGLRSVGSLLIQIPFFFAAYHFLKTFEQFDNVPFLFISNLSSADSLIPFGRYAIHVLPFIMTIINIISAQMYTLRKNPNALLATWGMAVLFFVLLYTSPAALVLYWTCNNIFSLLKNIVLKNLEHLNKHRVANAKQNILPIKITTSTIVSNKLSLFYSLESNIIRTISLLWGLALYFFLAFVFTPSNRLRGALPNSLVHATATILVISAIVLLFAQYFSLKQNTEPLRVGRNIFWAKLIIHLIALFIGFAIIVRYIFIPEFAVSTDSVKLKFLGMGFIILPNVLYLPFFVKYALAYYRGNTSKRPRKQSTTQTNVSIFSKQSRIDTLVYITASIYICVLIYFALPADIYKSAPLEVGIPFITIAKLNILYFISYVSILVALYKIAPKVIRPLLRYIVLSTASILFLYSILLPIDMGRMDNFSLIFPQKIVPTLGLYIVEALGLVGLLFMLSRVLQTRSKQLLILLVVCITILIGYVARPSVWKDYFGDKANKYVANSATSTANEVNNGNSTSIIPHSASDLLSFSRTEDNVVVILLDMVNGGHMQRALDEIPSLATIYNGFTWYPNTLSISTFTTSSKPSIMAGWQYTPENIAKVEGENLAQKVVSAYDIMLNTFLQHKYQTAITGVSYYGGDSAQCEILEKRNIACLDYWDNSYIGYWLAKNGDTNQSIADTTLPNSKKIALLVSAGLLRAVPLAFKQAIYDKGNWNLLVSEFKNQEAYNWAIQDWSFLDSMESLSTVSTSSKLAQSSNNSDNNKDTIDKPTFKFIHTNLTHRPYALDATCTLRNDVFPDEEAGNDFEGNAAYYSFRCTLESLARWINWLKEQGIYDNTKIIMLSDHGNDFDDDPMNSNNIAPKMMGREDSDIFSRSHVLLMVKDFARNKLTQSTENLDNNSVATKEQTEQLQIDYRFLSNTDVASIMFFSIPDYRPPVGSLDDDKIDRTKIAYETAEPRTLPIYHTSFYNWIDLVKEPTSFEIIDKYEVQDNIFKPSNWKKVIGEKPSKGK